MIKDKINFQGSTLRLLDEGYTIYIETQKGRGIEMKLTKPLKEKSKVEKRNERPIR